MRFSSKRHGVSIRTATQSDLDHMQSKIADGGIPEKYFFEDLQVTCPQCGGHKIFPAGGAIYGQSEISFYLCYTCKKGFVVNSPQKYLPGG